MHVYDTRRQRPGPALGPSLLTIGGTFFPRRGKRHALSRRNHLAIRGDDEKIEKRRGAVWPRDRAAERWRVSRYFYSLLTRDMSPFAYVSDPRLRVKRRRLPFVPLPLRSSPLSVSLLRPWLDPAVSLRVIAMVCGLSPWLHRYSIIFIMTPATPRLRHPAVSLFFSRFGTRRLTERGAWEEEDREKRGKSGEKEEKGENARRWPRRKGRDDGRKREERGRKGRRGRREETMEDEDPGSEKRGGKGGGRSRGKNTIDHFGVTQFNGRTVGTYIRSPRPSRLEDRLSIQGLTCTRCTIDLPRHYSSWKKRQHLSSLRAAPRRGHYGITGRHAGRCTCIFSRPFIGKLPATFRNNGPGGGSLVRGFNETHRA